MHTEQTSRFASTQPLQRVAANGATMGTRYAAVFYGNPASVPLGLPGALAAAVGTVDRQMSTWNPDSDLMRMNAAPVGVWIEAPDELLRVIEVGLAIGRLSGGAFDIGLLDVVDAWGFNSQERTPRPRQIDEAAAARRHPAHELLEVDGAAGRLRKLGPIAIDLSGIAKGFGVDQLSATMTAHGIASHIVSIDGEVRAHGQKADGNPWLVALETPEPGKRDVAGIIALEDAALATSGDYRHRVSLDGQTFSHTMDPGLRRPVVNDVQAVTVRASTCMEADAWATAVMVLGPDRGLALVRSLGMQALIARRDPVGRTPTMSGP